MASDDASQPADDGALRAHGEAPGEELLSLAEAAERAGVHENTIRRYLRSGEVPFYLRDLGSGEVVSGELPPERWPDRYKYLVPANAVGFIASQSNDSVRAEEAEVEEEAETSGEADRRQLSRVREELDEARRRLEVTREEAQRLADERDWLRDHLDTMTAFLPAAREDLQEAQSEVEQLQERARRLERERDLERQARRLASAAFRALPWYRRPFTDLEVLVEEELGRLRAEQSNVEDAEAAEPDTDDPDAPDDEPAGPSADPDR